MGNFTEKWENIKEKDAYDAVEDNALFPDATLIVER